MLSPQIRSCPQFRQTTPEQATENRSLLQNNKLRNAGELFNLLLKAVGIDRKTDCYITNIIKCRPPENRNPAEIEIKNCREMLAGELKLVRPKVIFTVGKIASESVIGKPIQMMKDNGTIHTLENVRFVTGVETIVVPMVHPAYVLRKIGSSEEARAKKMMGDAVRLGLRHIKFPRLLERNEQ